MTRRINFFYISLSIHAALFAVLVSTTLPGGSADEHHVVVDLVALPGSSLQFVKGQDFVVNAEPVTRSSNYKKGLSVNSYKSAEELYNTSADDVLLEDAINATSLSEYAHVLSKDKDSIRSFELKLGKSVELNTSVPKRSVPVDQLVSRDQVEISQTKLPRIKPNVLFSRSRQLASNSSYLAGDAQNTDVGGRRLTGRDEVIDQETGIEVLATKKTEKASLNRQGAIELSLRQQSSRISGTEEIVTDIGAERAKTTDNYAMVSSPAIIDDAKSSNKPPVYPTAARLKGIEGSVLLRVFLDRFGRPIRVVVAESSNFRSLDRAAVSAVKTWSFIPAKQRGHNVSAIVNVPVRFILTDS